ncbi:hypothetical protein [Amycolatopsis sp. H20-H5]|uniref:hypothetical protein n=1 Tax=Amycolatopsis sp. H20-H5 TaxID=3046309 RepID=UPI002DB66CA6|nr:hypothetical protein [Amycolatopsis sp. H20-H5]MEC3977173.1 hypothetical protein [Amycolatopsis sp. H20-H5]
MMKTHFERSLARWRGPLRRRHKNPDFLEPAIPQPQPQPAWSSGSPVAAGAGSPFTDTFKSAGPAATSTRDVAARSQVVDLFREMNETVEKFARAHRRSLGLDQRGEQIAYLMASVAEAVFDETRDVDSQVRSRLGIDARGEHRELAQLVERAYVLRDKLRRVDNMRVDFGARAGEIVDGERQEPWKTSIPDAPVRFLVFPGLTSGGNVVVKQQVYTVSLREARLRGAATQV